MLFLKSRNCVRTQLDDVGQKMVINSLKKNALIVFCRIFV